MNKSQINTTITELRNSLNGYRDSASKSVPWREKRSEETRRTLMEQAVICIVERGYPNTKIQSLCEMTGLSRSAILYHYPSRIELISAAIDYIFVRMIEMVYEGVDAFAESGGIDEQSANDLHWQVVCSDVYTAYIELNIASRTDASLKAHFDPKAIAFDMLWQEKMEEILGDLTSQKKDAVLAWDFARCVLESLRVNDRVLASPERKGAVRDLVVRIMQAMNNHQL
ncbi:MAG: TetR/AcrR family transcriptional regulator [Pseudomonadota bacterium]